MRVREKDWLQQPNKDAEPVLCVVVANSIRLTALLCSGADTDTHTLSQTLCFLLFLLLLFISSLSLFLLLSLYCISLF